MAPVQIDTRSGASYTVATNAQLLGGNLTACCESSEEKERERKILRRRTRFALRQTGFGYTHPCPAASPARPSAVFCTLPEEIIDDEDLTTPTQQSFDAASMLCTASGSTEDRTPTQRSFDEAATVDTRLHAADVPSPDGHPRRFSVGTDIVDRLLGGLLHSPLLRKWNGNVHKAKLDKSTEGLRPQDTRSELPLEDPGGAAATDSVLQTLRDRLNALQAPKTHLVGLALVDAEVYSAPAVMHSASAAAKSAVVDVGYCIHLDNPLASSVGPALHMIEDAVTGQTTVLLQTVTQVLQSATGKPIHYLVADFDITGSIAKAALTELLTTTTTSPAQDRSSEVDIWLQLARESDNPPQELKDILDTTLSRLGTLTPETCSMQTLTLLATLQRLERHFRAFYVLRTLEVHANRVPAKVDVPFVSRHLHQSVSEEDREELRDLMVSVLGKFGAGGTELYYPLRGSVDHKGLRFVPLSGGRDCGKLVWVCSLVCGDDVIDC